MNRILCGLFALGLVFAVAQSLQCYSCPLTICSSPSLVTTTICESGQQCFSGVGKAASIININLKGCLSASECNRTSDGPFGQNNTVYQMTKTCCSTDLCNLAPRGTYGSFLSIALVTLTGAMITGALV